MAKARKERHHATRAEDVGDWDVARDAVLEHDVAHAAQIVASIREASHIPSYAAITMDAPKTFVDALEEVPAAVRTRLYDALKKIQTSSKKPGSAEFAEKAPGVMTLYVPNHGYFSAEAPVYLRYKQMSRAKLLAKVLQIYEGTGEDSAKASHWKGYDKDYLAMIIADAYGDDAFWEP